MDQWGAIALAVIGFGPAILMLYIILYRFEGMFNEKRLFFLFAIGMVCGMAVAAAHSWLAPLYLSDIMLAFLILVVAFSLLEELLKAVILNYPLFLLKHETPFFGSGLGAGIGSMIVIALGQSSLTAIGELSIGQLLEVGAILTLYSFSMATLHGSTGVLIGYGAASGEIRRYIFMACLLHIIYNLFYLAFLYFQSILVYGSLGFLVAGLAFTAYIFYMYIYDGVLPEALPDKMKSIRRRRMRGR